MPAAAPALRFANFELQPQERRLLADGRDAGLGGRALDVLIVLAQRAGQLVSRNELIDLAWPGLVVEENNLSVQISALRKMLGGTIIATVPGRGYRFTAPIQDAPAPPPEAPAAAAKLKTNLPAALPPLIGRDDDLAALGTLLDQHRLVTLVGSGGIGKTLLAQHLLHQRRQRYAHGVCWVELAPVTEATALPGAIAAALGVHAAAADDAIAALARTLAPLDMLIALDNAEHLLADVAAVAEALVHTTPNLRLLVTSQAPLKLAAERVIRLGSLAVPLGPLPAQEALAFGAVALFVERAQAADAHFVLTNAAAPAVIELCRALDGMALAIELAAARAPTLGVQRLAASMHERLRVLTSSRNRTAPARQQTLRAALEWSHALLHEREQAVFRRLAVVAGSASLELIQRIAACERWNEWDVLDALDVLVERSLVAVIATADDKVPRYRLLESPRAYARDRLDAAGELHRLQRAHAVALRELLTAMRDDREAGRTPYEANREATRLDLDNARDAFTWARAEGELVLAVELGALLLDVLGQAEETELFAMCDSVEALLAHSMPPELQARAWHDVSYGLRNTRTRRSLSAAQRATEIARSLPPSASERALLLYLSLCRVASSAARTADEATARIALDELLGMEQATWPLPVLIRGRQAQLTRLSFGDPAACIAVCQQQIELLGRVGMTKVPVIITLVDAQLQVSDARSAAESGQQLLAQLEGSRHQDDLAYVRLNLAAAYLAFDDRAQARPFLEAGWQQSAVFVHMRPYFADYLALLAALDSRPETAARLCGYADAAYVAFDDARQPNEAAAIERARTLARAALGDAAFERLQADGARLTSDEAAAVAFGCTP